MIEQGLRSEQVSLGYTGTEKPVIEDLSLVVAEGLITTIIGPNGCGKSTLLRALGRLLKPTTGSVVLDGEMIHRLSTKEVARRLGLLTQQPRAPQGISVEDLVRRGRYPHQGFFQPPTAGDEEAVERALVMADVARLRKRSVDSLSGGQRQRAWIAMALAQETKLLLLDEPTTFLDIAHQGEVVRLVKRLNDEGKTILMVLHDVNEAATASHRIVAMREGRVVRAGTPAEVIDEDLLGDLYGVECDVFPHPSQGQPVCLPRTRQVIGAGVVEPTVSIEARGLTTGYDRRTTVSRDLSLTFPRGAITSIVGPNGCGKSTLLRTGGRLLAPLGGVFLIDGADSHKGSRKALAGRLSIVMQGAHPPPGFLVEDVVAAGRIPHQSPLRQWSRTDAAAITDALETCGLADLRFREVDTLSGGQMQRTWIAMALAQDTPVLFLDEPTTFLDLGYQIEVLDLVHRLNRDDGRTIVMVLHDLNLASRYSDFIVAMKDGAIVASGPPAEIVTEDLGRDVFGLESMVITDARTGRPVVLPLEPGLRDGLETLRPLDLIAGGGRDI